MRKLALFLTLMMVTSSHATLVIDSIQTGPNQFAIEVTTDVTFDSIEIRVDGNVENGVNIVPINATTMGRHYTTFTPTFTILTPLGTDVEPDGVFEPGISGSDIDMTYGVTTPSPGTWTVGLTNAPFLGFDLLSGVANITVNLRLKSATPIATSTMQVSVPEAGTVLCLSTLVTGTILAALYRRAKCQRLPPRHSPACDENGYL